MIFRTTEIRRNSKAEWTFKCKDCKKSGLPHYSQASALRDRHEHRCEDAI